jgi:monovalent cation:H+ antiporter-2, CPA2 family
MPAFLPEVVALFAAGAVIAYVCHRLGLVPIAGFLIAGVMIGPHALGLVRNRALVDAVAEAGVILLLFTIGIEVSMEKLARVKRLIFVGGGLQVVLASAATCALLALFGVPWKLGLFTGFLVSLSSTAIVLKLLGERGEAGTTHGQVGLGLLIFQDLAVIVMVLLVPMLGGTSGSAGDILWALGKAGALIALVLLGARRLMPRLLEAVARTCSPELFLLTVIAVCFGTAYLTNLAGVSLSLGAFLAGLLVGESSFSQHALGEILPLEILFSATFFVSVGMLLDVGFLVRHLPLVFLGIVAVLVVKVLTTAGAVRALGYPLPVASVSGLMLAQVGEFSFVLERAGREAGLSPAGLGDSGAQAFIAATVVLMLLTPALTALGVRVAGRIERRHAAAEPTAPEAPLPAHFDHLADHVVIAGYGQAARCLVRVLEGSGIKYLITTLSPGGANEAEAEGLPVLRGDYTKLHTLERARVDKAKMMVIADDDPATVHRVAAVARPLNPDLRIVARTRYTAEIEPLRAAGVDLVVAEEMESIVQVFAEVLRGFRVAPEEIEAREAAIRAGGYRALRPEAEPAVPAASEAGKGVDVERTIELRTTVKACQHLGATRPVTPSARGCEDCLRIGDDWVHLRLCMTCGHVGCCDSSKNKHATGHHRATTHPIVKSLEAGEDWGWCYVDEVEL